MTMKRVYFQCKVQNEKTNTHTQKAVYCHIRQVVIRKRTSINQCSLDRLGFCSASTGTFTSERLSIPQ